MSVCVHYWAIPPQSRLYQRLQQDSAFNTLMASLFPYGCGIYRLFEIEPEEVEEIIDAVIQRHRAVLGSNTKARCRIAEVRAELERTCVEFPGIEKRAYMVEKCSSDIEQRLLQALRNDHPDAAELTSKMLFGDKLLAPHLRKPGEDILGLASLSLVQEAAGILGRLRPKYLFPSSEGWEKWCRENYTKWRKMYLETAEHGEEILIGVS